MNVVDWIVLLATIVGIAAYGAWRTRQVRSLNTYLRGKASTGWGTIGLSVMATQASAITYDDRKSSARPTTRSNPDANGKNL